MKERRSGSRCVQGTPRKRTKACSKLACAELNPACLRGPLVPNPVLHQPRPRRRAGCIRSSLCYCFSQTRYRSQFSSFRPSRRSIAKRSDFAIEWSAHVQRPCRPRTSICTAVIGRWETTTKQLAILLLPNKSMLPVRRTTESTHKFPGRVLTALAVRLNCAASHRSLRRSPLDAYLGEAS